MFGPFFFSFFPIVVLIGMITNRYKPIPSPIALPFCAFLLYLIKLIYFEDDPISVHATVFSGVVLAFTPITIVGGAFLLFRTMKIGGSLAVIKRVLNAISTNRIAQVLIIGWAFSFLLEGTAGAGTPAAITAPVLLTLGIPAENVACMCLIFNSAPVSFGAVGTPLWFGYADLGLAEETLQQIGLKTALCHSAAMTIIPFLALSQSVPIQEIMQNIGFIILSICSCILPYLLTATVNYELPSLVGGTVGLILIPLWALCGIGLAPSPPPSESVVDTEDHSGGTNNNDKAGGGGGGGGGGGTTEEALPALATDPINSRTIFKATFPLIGTTVLLLITRIAALGLKGWLTSSNTLLLDIPLGSLMKRFSVSSSLVISFKNIFGTTVSAVHPTLFIPSFLPFGAVALLSCFVLNIPLAQIGKATLETCSSLRKPSQALIGGMILVKLLLLSTGEGESIKCTAIIGNTLADILGKWWIVISSYLGALGAFFSGSNLVSNLTFGGIQHSIAVQLGLDRSTILALQNVGGAMGNMVCINNIIAVSTIIGLKDKEAAIMKRTFLPCMVYGVIVTIVGSVIWW